MLTVYNYLTGLYALRTEVTRHTTWSFSDIKYCKEYTIITSTTTTTTNNNNNNSNNNNNKGHILRSHLFTMYIPFQTFINNLKKPCNYNVNFC